MAMAGSYDAANFSSTVEGKRFHAGDKSLCSLGQVQEADNHKWALSSSRNGTEGDRYDSRKCFNGAPVEAGNFSPKNVGCGSLGADGMGSVYAQNRLIADESYGSGRFLLSCSMASARAKKKKRSRATSKAPIKVFATDTSNFMAMVHKLTGISSNTFPLYSSPPPFASSKLSPFNQSMPNLDTSSVLVPGDRAPSGGAYSVLPALPSQQLFNTMGSAMEASNQVGQPLVNINTESVSNSDLMRSLRNGSTSSLPDLWGASQKNLQQSSTSEREGMPTVKVSSLPASCNLPLLAEARDKLASTEEWALYTTISTRNEAKEELS